MKILAIETSCDETAVSVVRVDSEAENVRFTVLGDALLSQAKLHQKYGGVFPTLAKREHAKNLVPLLEKCLEEAKLFKREKRTISKEEHTLLKELFSREPELFETFTAFIEENGKPHIDALAVTHGPGLEPALWVGLNFAKALAFMWQVPLIAVNHMEGHIFSSVLQERSEREYQIPEIAFPALALLISGGHTELVLIKKWGEYELVGKTRDDALGEAFDKVARLLSLPYPGGPEISKLAERAREENQKTEEKLPRAMIDSNDFDFSFSGIKTAILYRVKNKKLTTDEKRKLAREFEDAVTEVLIKKATKAIRETEAQTLILGGGVSANKHIRGAMEKAIKNLENPVALFLPPQNLTTDNAVMIAIAGWHTYEKGMALDCEEIYALKAQGGLKLAKTP